MATSTIQNNRGYKVLFNTATDVSSTTTITLNENAMGKFSQVVINFSGDAGNTGMLRAILSIPGRNVGYSAYFPLCIQGTNGYVRAEISGPNLTIITTSFSSLYVQSVVGII